MASCPVVLELEASSVRLVKYHRTLKHVFVVPGTTDQVLPGIRVRAFWWDATRVRNYIRLTYDARLRSKIIGAPTGRHVLCGQGRAEKDFQTCGKLIHLPWAAPDADGDSVTGTRVGKYFMCEQCAAAWK